MVEAETGMGGAREAFPETAWSSILSRKPGDEARRERMERLVRGYWRPVYKYIRAGWSKSVEDAKDLTQEFFARIVSGDLVLAYEPGRGRFRQYLKGALQHFLTKE